MSLLFMDGFDHYATADLTKKWSSNASCTISAAGGRRSGGALVVPINSANVTKTLAAASASFVMGAAFKTDVLVAKAIFSLLDAGNAQCELRMNADGTLSVTRAGSALTSGTSTNAITTGVFYYVEWKVTIADSIGVGSCVVKVNGATWITVATGQDTKATANASANQITLNGSTSTNTATFDDFYICDLSGSAPQNDFLGDCRIDCQFPNADGSNSTWTPSTGTTHYTLVDEATPNTTDYVESNVIGNKDTWAFQDLSSITGTIYGVQINTAALKDDAGGRSIINTVKSGATNADGATQAMSTSQIYYLDIFATDPATTAAWTESAVNAAEFGVKVAA